VVREEGDDVLWDAGLAHARFLPMGS
jgi:hypothetical protein